jgi:hypothetical protein
VTTDAWPETGDAERWIETGAWLVTGAIER